MGQRQIDAWDKEWRKLTKKVWWCCWWVITELYNSLAPHVCRLPLSMKLSSLCKTVPSLLGCSETNHTISRDNPEPTQRNQVWRQGTKKYQAAHGNNASPTTRSWASEALCHFPCAVLQVDLVQPRGAASLALRVRSDSADVTRWSRGGGRSVVPGSLGVSPPVFGCLPRWQPGYPQPPHRERLLNTQLPRCLVRNTGKFKLEKLSDFHLSSYYGYLLKKVCDYFCVLFAKIFWGFSFVKEKQDTEFTFIIRNCSACKQWISQASVVWPLTSLVFLRRREEMCWIPARLLPRNLANNVSEQKTPTNVCLRRIRGRKPVTNLWLLSTCSSVAAQCSVSADTTSLESPCRSQAT